jgi:hypothetical protein
MNQPAINPASLLALLSSLFEQVVDLQHENARLRQQVEEQFEAKGPDAAQP